MELKLVKSQKLKAFVFRSKWRHPKIIKDKKNGRKKNICLRMNCFKDKKSKALESDIFTKKVK
jgi:hypothetical protein